MLAAVVQIIFSWVITGGWLVWCGLLARYYFNIIHGGAVVRWWLLKIISKRRRVLCS
jgi:hypothetical protein